MTIVLFFFNVLSIKVGITETINGFTCGCAKKNNNYYSSVIATKHNIVHCTVARMLLSAFFSNFFAYRVIVNRTYLYVHRGYT